MTTGFYTTDPVALRKAVQEFMRYRCRVCHKWYESRQTLMSCCVQHQLGDCCHAFEVEVTKKGWRKPPFNRKESIR